MLCLKASRPHTRNWKSHTRPQRLPLIGQEGTPNTSRTVQAALLARQSESLQTQHPATADSFKRLPLTPFLTVQGTAQDAPSQTRLQPTYLTQLSFSFPSCCLP